jgi:hypothetical protein
MGESTRSKQARWSHGRFATVASCNKEDQSSTESHVNLGNDERLVDMTASDLRALLVEAVRDVIELRPPGGDTGELLTTEELAKRIKISPDTARKWRREGCPHVAVGEKKLRWRLADVLRWREELGRD